MSEERRRPKSKTEIMHSFFSGGVAGVIAKTTVAPLERVKLIFITSKTQFRYVDGVKKFQEIYSTEGFLSLWRGNSLSCLRTFFYAAIVDTC
jgi:hypothetical protein